MLIAINKFSIIVIKNIRDTANARTGNPHNDTVCRIL